MKKNLRKIGFILALGTISFSMVNCGGMSEEEAAKMAAEMEASMNSAFDEALTESTKETTYGDELIEYNLAEYGIPVTIVGPEGASVKSDLTEEGRIDFDAESYSVTKGKFAITVYMDNDPAGNTVESSIEDSRETMEGTIVEEIDNGFIFVDEYGSHDFVYVVEKDEKIVEFSVGLTFDDLSKEDVHTLINSIRI